MFVSSSNHMFAGQILGGNITQKIKLNTAFVFKLPIHRMSANGNAEELHLHPWQHLCRKQLWATNDYCLLIWDPWQYSREDGPGSSRKTSLPTEVSDHIVKQQMTG